MQDNPFSVFPELGGPYDEDRASPHIMNIEELYQRFGFNNHRIKLTGSLKNFIADVESLSFSIDFLLVGGSFISGAPSPNDIDGLLGYRATSNSDFGGLVKLYNEKTSQMDIALTAVDVGISFLIKKVCFFHTLYQGWPNPKTRGSVLVTHF